MNKKRIDWLTAVMTFAASFVICFIAIELLRDCDSAGALIVGTGLFFALAVFISCLLVRLCGRIRPRLKFAIPVTLRFQAIMVALCFVVGAAGQFFYCFQISTKKSTVGSCDVVIMLDDSGSMVADAENIRKAAVDFVDNLSDSCRAAGGCFADEVYRFQDLVYTDDAGKAALRDFFDISHRVSGSTDLDKALTKACDCLLAEANSREKAVIIVTDGKGSINKATVDSYLRSGIKLYSIRFGMSNRSDALSTFAEQTGGFDTMISSFNYSSSDLDKILKAFQNIQDVVQNERETGFTSDLLVFDNEITAMKLIIRFVTLVLLSLLIQIAMFRGVRIAGIILTLILGAAASALVYVAGQIDETIPAAIVLSLCIFTVFIKLNLNDKEENDVR